MEVQDAHRSVQRRGCTQRGSRMHTAGCSAGYTQCGAGYARSGGAQDAHSGEQDVRSGVQCRFPLPPSRGRRGAEPERLVLSYGSFKTGGRWAGRGARAAPGGGGGGVPARVRLCPGP